MVCNKPNAACADLVEDCFSNAANATSIPPACNTGLTPASDDEHKSEEGESEEGPTEGFLQEDELKNYATDYLRKQASQRRQPATQAQHASQASSQLASKPASQNSDAASNGSSPARISEPTSELRRSDRSRPPSAKAIATAESNALATLGAADIPTEATLHLHPEKKHIIAAEARSSKAYRVRRVRVVKAPFSGHWQEGDWIEICVLPQQCGRSQAFSGRPQAIIGVEGSFRGAGVLPNSWSKLL